MASNMQSFPRILKMLRENSSDKDKRESLAYIRSNSKKLESSKAIKEEQYKELCKLVIFAFANGNTDVQNEAYETLNIIIQDFKDHSINLFEVMLRVGPKTRLKILKLLEVVGDIAISTVADNVHAVNFFNGCLCTIQRDTMPWTTACVGNFKALIEAEKTPLSDDQRIEEETINYSLTLLRRLYKVAAMTPDIKIQRFDALLLDKVMILAYMGHKRQRGPALKLLQQALATNTASYIRTHMADAWAQYKVTLQTTYCERMLLLVSACELDWATQWNISIQFLGAELHRGAGLINNLLSVEEKAFKSTETIIRRQAFLSWKLLVDNFALDPQELATARRIKLLCIPLNAKNSKNELIALTKLEVWWHVIIKLYKDITKFVNPVITQFLNFCFGPLGDTPLLSSKFDIMASPGKRFFKTKVVAVDALCQLLVTKQENHTVFSPILEERLPYSISDSIFQECYKSIIHSVGEALLVLSQLTDAEMKNRYQLGKILWISLVNYIQESQVEEKELMYKNMILVITELTNYAVDKLMIRNLILDIILFEIADLSKNFNLQDDILSKLVLKLLQAPILNEAQRNHCEALKRLCWRCIKSQKSNEYYMHAFKYLKEIYGKLCTLSNVENKNEIVISELWRILAEILIKYMDDLQEINEGNSAEHNLKTVESIIIFPFMWISLEDQKQVQEFSKTWKSLYRQFEIRTSLIATVKPNEILLNIANSMQSCLAQNKESYHLIANCIDSLLSNVNYKFLLANAEVPPILNLILKLIPLTLSSQNHVECESTLKAFSAILITIYGHDPQKVISYLQICRPTIELILESESELLYKEIASTWETVVTIFKGLNKLIDRDLISSYKKAIIQALNHSNQDIQIQTAFLYEVQNMLKTNMDLILDDIVKEVITIKALDESDITEKNELVEKLPNQDKPVGSFLNSESNSPKTVFTESEKSAEKILPDSDSQDYVFIKTDFKFDVNRLTEHQKESFKRRREDIPALYNDLSQSSSLDTQNLQDWFDKRNQNLEDVEEIDIKEHDILNYNANEENKNKVEELEIINESSTQNDTNPTENVGQGISLNSAQISNTNINNCEISFIENIKIITGDVYKHSEASIPLDIEANDLDLDCQKEFSENKSNDRKLSPSILDNNKRRSRYNCVVKSSISPKLEEIVDSQPGHSNTTQTLQRTLRPKVIQSQHKLINKQKITDTMENKSLEEDRKGIKRKSISDSESEGINQRRRRKTNSFETVSDSDSCKSTEGDSVSMNIEEIIDDANLSQRTRNEISRLRINMVFDSPLSNSRRSKGYEDKEVVGKRQSPESKCTRLRLGGNQKSNGKEVHSTQFQNRRGRSSRTKVKPDKDNEFNKTEETKKGSQNKRNELEEKKKLDEEKEGEDNIEAENSQSPKAISDIKFDLLDIKKSNKIKIISMDDMSNNETQTRDVDLSESIAKDQNDETEQIQDDVEDIIENSQDLSQLEKKCNEKQCFIKVNKISDLCSTMKLQEIIGEDEEVAKIVSNNCDNDNNEVPKDTIKEFKDSNETSVDKPKNTTPVSENNSSDNEKDVTCEVQKVNEGLSGKSPTGFSSPKSNIKRQLKFKPYTPQGRAAHMLGLVTKQARVENDRQIMNIDDDSVVKKMKTKDTDNEVFLGKKDRGPTFKEVDKVTASCSSRQEKIFNNMRSSDYCPSPPIKLFSNLKNDGEKIFSKIDKPIDYIPIQTDTEAETIETFEMAELPILEWSSANPPSLTASPSASILKRHRQSVPEPDSESTTPNKRKRVSFADPPVSKEMGYEITSNGSSPKGNKYVPHGLIGRKDSPLKLKPIKQKLIHINLGKGGTDVVDTTEVDLHYDNENDLLIKITEALEHSEIVQIVTDFEVPGDSVETEPINTIFKGVNKCNKIEMNNLRHEYEITQGTTFSKHKELKSKNETEQDKENTVLRTPRASNLGMENMELNNSETQEDIFNGTDTLHNNNIEVTKANNDNNISGAQKISIQNNSLDSPKFNTTNDSIKNNSFEKSINSENLEDTVDADNLTSLNSTENLEEVFCERFIRTSTQAVENMEEQDTLPVTDSVFESLPLSQDSHNTAEFNAEIRDPEILNSTQPIYPALVSCSEPIKSILEQLTNPLWLQNLSTYFVNSNLNTIGDLARLSEREANRIPVKGNPKIEFIKSVLNWFEKTHVIKETNNRTEVSSSVNDDVSTSTPEKAYQDQALNTTFEITQKESTNLCSSFIQTSSNSVSNIVTESDKNASETTKNETKSVLDESSNTHVVDVCSTFTQTLQHESITAITSDFTSASKSTDVTTTCTINRPVLSALSTAITSEIVAENSSSSDTNATSVPHSTKTVGTCTSSDYICQSKISKATKSVAAQMALEDLLDEIDVNLVLESAARRCTPEKILLQYKNKMRHVPQAELERETIRILGAENRKDCNEVTLKAACRACGINKVLLRLPDIFSGDKQFFIKVLSAYRKKIKTSDCLDILDFAEVKDAVCQKCTSSELAEMLSKRLKEEEQEGIKTPMTELSSLDAMLKRMPTDLIISHTVANEELIPARVVLDIALQNNSSNVIAQALESQPCLVMNVFERLRSSQFVVEHIEEYCKSQEDLSKIFKAVSSKMGEHDLLQGFYESMNMKVTLKHEKD